jgi:hypothetical protein
VVKQDGAPGGDDKRRRQKRESANRISADGREIGSPPDPPTGADAELREKCDESLLFFLETCFPMAFPLAWSNDHLRMIEAIERTVLLGLLKALAMPRGSGKTTLIIRAALWAILTGNRRFVCIIAATETAAKKLLKGIKTELLHNEMLAKLYAPELHAVLALGGEPKRASQQTCEGELTGVEWLTEQISFGCIEGVRTCGAAISTCGITGNIRGQQYTLTSGEIIRPDCCLVEDPQTKESAKSKNQCDERHETMMGDVLGMAGPNIKVAAFCTCTVIYEDDLADRLLNRRLSPDWHGDKCQMVYKWPKDEVIWDEYRAVREAELRDDGDGTKANEFVERHYDRMHEGSEVGWPARKTHHEISALQHAYNLRFRDEGTFFAEYQNTPLSTATEVPFELRVDEIAERITRTTRNRVPAECEKITAQIDVQQNVLFYCVTAWTLDGRGHVIDYGTWPDQRRTNFKKRDIRKTLQDAAGTEGLNEAIYAGLESLTDKLLGRVYKRVDGAQMVIDRCGVDARWGQSTRVVRRFGRETKYTGKVIPTFGQYVGVNSRPWHKQKVTTQERGGIHCRIQPPPKNVRGVRELLIDTNWWKSFAAERLLTGKGSDKSIVLFKAEPHKHRMFAEHCCCETPELKTGKLGNKLIEWQQPDNAENDFWDCLVGTCVLASLEGVQVHVEKVQQKKKKRNRRPRVSELKC